MMKNILNFNTSGALPGWILLFIAGFYPLVVIPNPVSYFYAPRSFILLFLGLLGVYWFVRLKVSVPMHVMLPLGIFLLLGFVSTLTANDTAVAWFGNIFRFSGYAVYLACGVVLLLALKKGEGNKLLAALIACASVVGLIAVMQHFGLDIVPHEAYRSINRSFATLGNPNFLGTYTVFILPAAIIFYLRQGRIKWLIAAALIYAGLLTSSTRGAWLALPWLMICIILWEVNKDRKKQLFFLILVTTLLIVSIGLNASNNMLLKRTVSIPKEISSAIKLENQAGANRLNIWKEIVALIPEYWAFGIGPDNLINANISTSRVIVDKAHNIYLEMAVTMGVPALLAWLGLVLQSLRGWRDQEGFIYAVMISTYLVQGFFNIDVVMILPLFWMVMGLGLQRRGNSLAIDSGVENLPGGETGRNGGG